jgi:hypothetical protein
MVKLLSSKRDGSISRVKTEVPHDVPQRSFGFVILNPVIVSETINFAATSSA